MYDLDIDLLRSFPFASSLSACCLWLYRVFVRPPQTYSRHVLSVTLTYNSCNCAHFAYNFECGKLKTKQKCARALALHQTLQLLFIFKLFGFNIFQFLACHCIGCVHAVFLQFYFILWWWFEIISCTWHYNNSTHECGPKEAQIQALKEHKMNEHTCAYVIWCLLMLCGNFFLTKSYRINNKIEWRVYFYLFKLPSFLLLLLYHSPCHMLFDL